MPAKPEHAATVAAPKRIRRTQAERRAESERLILEAAIRTIGQKGSAQTTLAEVGIAAGYSRGLPAHVFGSKDNLILKAAQSVMAMPPSHSLFAVKTTGGIAGMLQTVERWFLITKDRPDEIRGLLVLWSEGMPGNAASRSPELHSFLQTLDEAARLHFREFLRDAMTRGELRPDIDIDTQATLILGAIRGILWQWIIMPDAFDLFEIGRSYVRELRRTLTTLE